MAIWDTFLLFAYQTAIGNGRVKTEASQLFSDHQQWFAAFLLAFPEAAVVPHDERDALSALISTSRKPSMWKIKDRALQWLSRSLRPVTGEIAIRVCLVAQRANWQERAPPIEERGGSWHSRVAAIRRRLHHTFKCSLAA